MFSYGAIAEKKLMWHMPTIYSEKLRFTMSVWNRICIQVLEAIKFMHYSNIQHNDIKSNNIILKVMNKDEDICFVINGIIRFLVSVIFSSHILQ